MKNDQPETAPDPCAKAIEQTIRRRKAEEDQKRQWIPLDYVPGPQLRKLPAWERIDPEPPAPKPRADTGPPLNVDEEKEDKS
jgi:hypothetical protein